MKLLTTPWLGTPLAQHRTLRHSRCVTTSPFLLRQRIRASHSAGSRLSSYRISDIALLRKEEPFFFGEDFIRPRQTPGFYRGITPGTPRAIRSRPSVPSASLMTSAIGSASFYPIQGFFYLWRDEGRELLLKRIGKFAAEVTVASAAVLGALAGFTFQAQRSVLLNVVPQFFGTPGTIIVILIETAIPISLLFYHRLRRTQDKIFDDVLSLQGIQVEKSSPDEREWIDEQREIQWQQKQQVSTPRTPVGAVRHPDALDQHPMRKYLLTLPLNFIPVVGSVAFVYMNAVGTSSTLHHHYYSDLKGLSGDEEATVIQHREKQYRQFGVMADALTLVPGMNAALVLTNAIGAALWAADMEKALQKQKKKQIRQ